MNISTINEVERRKVLSKILQMLVILMVCIEVRSDNHEYIYVWYTHFHKVYVNAIMYIQKNLQE